MNTKTFKIDATGVIPSDVNHWIMKYNGQVADKNTINDLDSDIEFVVCDLKIAHGNLNKNSKDAWLCPRNGDNSWNIRITFQ